VKLSVIIPAYNEEKTISTILEEVLAVPIDKEVIVVNDASNDQTGKILDGFAANGKIRIITHPSNSGKGSAIRTGIKHATGDIIIIQDADLEYDPNDYQAVIQPIIDGKTAVSYGSRLSGARNKHSYVSFYLGGRLLSLLANFLYGSNITDEPTCYKAFKADLLKSIPLECTRFEFCPEITAKVLRRKLEIYEVPIHYYPRSKEEGKKIRWSDGIEAIWTLIKYKIKE
jgi:dolichol-phosphate mannosyltransferase